MNTLRKLEADWLADAKDLSERHPRSAQKITEVLEGSAADLAVLTPAWERLEIVSGAVVDALEGICPGLKFTAELREALEGVKAK